MSFQPVLPIDGYAGWRFLQRTQAAQQATLVAQPAAQRDEAYFRENIGTIKSAEDLVNDRRLLRVALTSFGLADDLPNRAYIRKVLESPTTDSRSFVNRLSDSRYKQMATAFGFGDGLALNTVPGFADSIISGFRDRSFEQAVGAQNDSMRLALALSRDLGQLAAQRSSDKAKWYKVLGTPSLRTVFETAFNLPSSFGTLDIDRQVDVLKERTARLTGKDTIGQFTDATAIDTLTKRFFLAGQIQQVQTTSAQGTALTLLQQGRDSLNAFLGR